MHVEIPDTTMASAFIKIDILVNFERCMWKCKTQQWLLLKDCLVNFESCPLDKNKATSWISVCCLKISLFVQTHFTFSSNAGGWSHLATR